MIAIDVMGGDFAPSVILQGAVKAASEGFSVNLFGPEDVIRGYLAQHSVSIANLPITITHTTELVAMDEEPVAVVKQKKDSSLVRAVSAVADGGADAAISAGNSGAMVVAGMLIVGREPGVERTPLVGSLPGERGPVILLDLGANADCKAQHLVQFAHLGVAFAQKVLQRSDIKVGLLSNGEEDKKGNLVTKEAFLLLKAEPLNFVGNIEPHDVLRNKVDVVVCDGFVGNVFLKSLEAVYASTGKAVLDVLQRVPAVSSDGKAVADAVRAELAAQAEQVSLGGALALGIKRPIFVCHGAAKAENIYKAIKYAAFYAKSNNK